MRKQYDVAVIGGGPAGYVAAIKAAQLGGRAAVFEKSVLGGTCLNRGCIPTKCYLKTAELMEEIAGCAQRGIVLDAHPSVNLPKAVAHKNSVVKKLTDGVAGLLRSHKIDVYYGEAALATETTLTCGGETYGFDSVLLCGGSKPGVIPIPGAESKNVLDNTGVHPESYGAAKELLKLCGFGEDDVKNGSLSGLADKVAALGEESVAQQIGVGVPTLQDIVKELLKPGRDPRDELPPPLLRTDILELKDLKPGMELTGTVRNVIDFGAFVDIGVHQDGLVHISQICNKYIKHPSEVLKVGDIVKVWVLNADPVKKRIGLTMKEPKQ